MKTVHISHFSYQQSSNAIVGKPHEAEEPTGIITVKKQSKTRSQVFYKAANKKHFRGRTHLIGHIVEGLFKRAIPGSWPKTKNGHNAYGALHLLQSEICITLLDAGQISLKAIRAHRRS